MDPGQRALDHLLEQSVDRRRARGAGERDPGTGGERRADVRRDEHLDEGERSAWIEEPEAPHEHVWALELEPVGGNVVDGGGERVQFLLAGVWGER